MRETATDYGPRDQATERPTDAFHRTLGQIDFAHSMGGPEFVNETEKLITAVADLLRRRTGCKPNRTLSGERVRDVWDRTNERSAARSLAK
jgi:hypothetical protein